MSQLSLNGPLGWFVGVSVAFMGGCCSLLFWARRMERRARLAAASSRDGGVLGVVGLPGDGKTSFIVTNYVVPALRQGRTVITNFEVFADSLPGKWLKVRRSTFAQDLLGIGSSLNVDEETDDVISGWFHDTACTCGKDHDADCERPRGDVPAKACCAGFRARRLCACNAVVLVVDEVHGFVPANQSRPLPIELHVWLTMIRKNHVLLIWSTQYWKWVHSTVRRLTPQGFECSRDIMATDRIVRMYDVDPHKAELIYDNVLTTIKFKPGQTAGEWYDSGEVIVPASTAQEMLSPMGRRSLGLAGSATKEHARPRSPHPKGVDRIA